MKQVACFDVCGTLYAGVTTWDFARDVADTRSALRRLALECGLRGSRVLAALGLGGLAHTVAIGSCLSVLRGCSVHELDRLADAFWSTRWPSHAHAEVLGLLETCLREGKTVILLSAAIAPPVEALARRLGVTAICSRLRIDEAGRVAGLQNDLLGDKRQALLQAIGEEALRSALFVSDNHTDIPLLTEVARGIRVLNHSHRGAPPETQQLETIHV
jgi:HAD superfamily phosphoserine phosphatase-like hydrolase